MEYITLSNGVKMPQLGYGVFQVTQEECERCVSDALKVGQTFQSNNSVDVYEDKIDCKKQEHCISMIQCSCFKLL